MLNIFLFSFSARSLRLTNQVIVVWCTQQKNVKFSKDVAELASSENFMKNVRSRCFTPASVKSHSRKLFKDDLKEFLLTSSEKIFKSKEIKNEKPVKIGKVGKGSKEPSKVLEKQNGVSCKVWKEVKFVTCTHFSSPEKCEPL